MAYDKNSEDEMAHYVNISQINSKNMQIKCIA